MEKDLFPGILFQTARAWRNQLDQRLKPLGLSQAKWRTLLQLDRSCIALTQKDLANLMGVEGPTVAGLIDRMEKDAWVVRKPHAEDRRSKTIHLTQKAKMTIQRIHNIANQLRAELLATVSKQDLLLCIKTLEHIKYSLDTSLSLHNERPEEN